MIEKDKREKVIKHIVDCVNAVDGLTNVQWVLAELDILKDALALLKAQEPHIVTIADYENNPNVDKDGNLAVWRESRHLNGIAYHNDGWVILNRNRVEGWFNSEMIRFWTSRPTDEQMEKVKWDG